MELSRRLLRGETASVQRHFEIAMALKDQKHFTHARRVLELARRSPGFAREPKERRPSSYNNSRYAPIKMTISLQNG